MNRLKFAAIVVAISCALSANLLAMEDQLPQGRVERVGSTLRNLGIASTLASSASFATDYLATFWTEYLLPFGEMIPPSWSEPALDAAQAVVPFLPSSEALLLTGATAVVLGEGLRYLGAQDRQVAQGLYNELLEEKETVDAENQRLRGSLLSQMKAISALQDDRNEHAAQLVRLKGKRDKLLARLRNQRAKAEIDYLYLENRLQEIEQELATSNSLISQRDIAIADQEETIAALFQKLNELDQSDLEDSVPSLLKVGSEEDDLNSLLTVRRVNGGIQFGLHHRFSRETYQALLDINDLSYARAKEFSRRNRPDRLPAIMARIAKIEGEMVGWSFKTFMGKTAGFNQEDDVACLVAHKPSESLIVVAFHGSQSGSFLSPSAWVRFLTGGWMPFQAEGDWDSNYNFYAQPASALSMNGQPPLRLLDMPENLQVYGGHARNFHSVQEAVMNEVQSLLAQHHGKAWILATGHSKGASVATIATVALAGRFGKVAEKVAAVTFSSPRPFCGDESRAAVHGIVGRRNIFRINVTGDPVSHFPSNLYPVNFRSVGVLFEDKFEAIKMRGETVYPDEDLSSWLKVGNWAVYHYGSNRRSDSLEFDPNLVMTYDELLEGLRLGIAKTGMNDSLIGGIVNNAN